MTASNNSELVPGRWTSARRDMGIIIWISFLAACLGSLIIFGLLDPQAMTSAWTENWDMGRKWGYTLGFGFLWLITFISASLTVFMLRSGPRKGYSTGADGDRPVSQANETDANILDLKDGKVVRNDQQG